MLTLMCSCHRSGRIIRRTKSEKSLRVPGLIHLTLRRDPMWLKLYVGVLMFADSLNTLFSCWWIFDLTIMQFGNLAKFAVANWSTYEHFYRRNTLLLITDIALTCSSRRRPGHGWDHCILLSSILCVALEGAHR